MISCRPSAPCWFGLLAPSHTPDAVIAKVHQAAVQALQTKDLRARLAAEAAEPVGSTPQEFQKFLGEETEKYARLVKQLNLRAD